MIKTNTSLKRTLLHPLFKIVVLSLSALTLQAHAINVDLTQTKSWNGGYIVGATITNDTAAAVNGWTLGFKLGSSIEKLSRATVMGADPYVVKSLSYSAKIAPGATESFAFTAAGTFNAANLGDCVFNGAACSLTVNGKLAAVGSSASAGVASSKAIVISASSISNVVDQCNTTNQCKNIFGSAATDCANSQSVMSVCMCGSTACSLGVLSSKPASSKPASSVPPSSKPASSKPAASVAPSSKPASSKPLSSVAPSSKAASSKPLSSVAPSSKPASSTPASSVAPSSKPASSKPASSKPASSKPASSVAASSSPALPAGTTLWSNPNTWGGQVPTSGDVTIRSDQKVVLDMDVKLNELIVNGELSCANKDLQVSAQTIMVHGRMDCGTKSRPYTKSLTITLTGKKPSNIVNDGRGMGIKVIGVMGGGILNLHGEERTSWLMLNETAQAGSRQLVLEQTTDWRVGDRLVVTSTSQNMKEAEEVTIASISGRILTLSSPLKYRHFGETQYFSSGSRSWTADTRAEVGLLSRNIKIVGDETSVAEKFGGHMMVMSGSAAYISGVQMDNLGQQGLLGRYPFHWHLAGDVTGQYIKNSAIYNSFNRCVTVHGSHNALIDDNVCFKHVGHGYFLEDGVETGNVFNHNLGAWTIKPPAADALIPSDIQDGLASRGPATFWISNGNNTYTNNAAAGSEGLGFWYDTEDVVTGPSRNMPGGDISPRRSHFAGFTDNRVHSSSMAFSTCSKSSGVPGYLAPNGTLFKNLTVFFGGKGAVWPCDGAHKFENLIVLDTGKNSGAAASFVAARPSKISNSLFVANSKLAGNSPQARAAFGIYDFGVEMTDSHVENYVESSQSPVYTEVGGALTFMHQSIERVTNKNTNYWLKLKSNNSDTSASVIRDLDNSIGFGRDMSLTPNLPLMVDSSCKNMDGIDQAKMCPGRFVQVRLNMGMSNLPAIELGRSDLSIKKPLTPGVVQRDFYKVHMPVNRSYLYEVDFKSEFTSGALRTRTKMSVQTDSGTDGDVATLSLKNLKPSARVTTAGWSKVSSMTALDNASGNAWYLQGSTLHLKMVCRGNNALLKARSVADIAF